MTSLRCSRRDGAVRRCAVLVIAIGWTTLSAAAQTQVWFDEFGTDGEDGAVALTTDGDGGVFLAAAAAGYSSGGVAGPGVGRGDVLLARYDAGGLRLWATRFGTPQERDEACAIVFDGAEGAFVVGTSYGGPLDPSGLPPRWLAHFDGQGAPTWERALQPQFSPNAGAANGTGGLLICGRTFGNANSFVASYDASGAVLWSTTVPILVNHWDEAIAVTSDGAGGAYLCGVSDEVFISYDGWLARVDHSGNLLWVRPIATPEHDYANAVTGDGNGGVYVGGSTAGSLAGPSQGSSDMWLARYDGAGNPLWIRQYGTFQPEGIRALASSEGGGVIAAARVNGKAFLSRFDAAGNLVYLTPIGVKVGWNFTESIVCDDPSRTYVAGGTEGASSAQGSSDAWLARYDGSCNPGKTYCVASSTSLPGCAAALTAGGSPTLSDPSAWTVSSGPVPGGNLGLLVFGSSGPDDTPYGTLGGKLCVAAPTFRAAPTSSGGEPGQCNGSFAITLADLIAASPIVTSGATIHAQVWARDPANPDGFLMSDGVAFTVCP